MGTVDDAYRSDKLSDPAVSRYVQLMDVLHSTLRSITGQDLKGHTAWREWWSRNRASFKVVD